MRTIPLKGFFSQINYDYTKDLDSIKTICHYTKTRVNPAQTEIKLTAGTEQTFLIKAIAEWRQATSFFEIGTGRGTACYAVSLLDHIKEINTVDILEFNQKFPTAIGFRPAVVSLSDIRTMIPFEQKHKIKFHNRKSLPQLTNLRADLCFIDGDHTSKSVLLEDYRCCRDIVNVSGIILWDDYDPNKFAVKGIVDDILNEDAGLDAILVEHRGHLFSDKPAEKDAGVVLMAAKGKLL
jgi:hypothetical protein